MFLIAPLYQKGTLISFNSIKVSNLSEAAKGRFRATPLGFEWAWLNMLSESRKGATVVLLELIEALAV